jgi:hypothetical protein
MTLRCFVRYEIDPLERDLFQERTFDETAVGACRRTSEYSGRPAA